MWLTLFYCQRSLSRRFLPKSPLGQAIDYALGQWPALQVFLGDGHIEIDNNLVENAIRPTALDPYAYLRDVLTRLPSLTTWQIKDVTPETLSKTKTTT